MTWAQAVANFNRKNGYPPPDRPQNISPELKILRLRLMMEELGELSCAMHEDRLIDVADGIVDLLYVVVGTANEYGLTLILEELFQEVHFSNMSKDVIVKPDGKKGGIKGPNFIPPDLATIILREQTKNNG